MNATTEHYNLSDYLRGTHLVCIEIGMTEIERVAQQDILQIPADKLSQVTAAALRNRPEHVADILLVSSWLLSEGLCTDAQRASVRQHFLSIARLTEESLS